MPFTDNASSVPVDSATAALHREMRVRIGDLPDTIGNVVYEDDCFVLSPEAFLFATESGVRFHYAVGNGITASLPGPECEDEFRLYLWGTVFGAVAWLNELFPLHASAVAVGDRAVAFTADSGVGKSTLAAALAARGLPHLCDDTLPVLLSAGPPMAIPDRKPLKLWEDAFALVAAERLEPITSMPGKSYAWAANRFEGALPLGALVVLEEGDELNMSPIRGTAKLDALVEAMYRDFIPVALGRTEAYHRDLLALARGVEVWRLVRPRASSAEEFRLTTERIEGLIASIPNFT